MAIVNAIDSSLNGTKKSQSTSSSQKYDANGNYVTPATSNKPMPQTSGAVYDNKYDSNGNYVKPTYSSEKYVAPSSSSGSLVDRSGQDNNNNTVNNDNPINTNLGSNNDYGDNNQVTYATEEQKSSSYNDILSAWLDALLKKVESSIASSRNATQQNANAYSRQGQKTLNRLKKMASSGNLYGDMISEQNRAYANVNKNVNEINKTGAEDVANIKSSAMDNILNLYNNAMANSSNINTDVFNKVKKTQSNINNL